MGKRYKCLKCGEPLGVSGYCPECTAATFEMEAVPPTDLEEAQEIIGVLERQRDQLLEECARASRAQSRAENEAQRAVELGQRVEAMDAAFRQCVHWTDRFIEVLKVVRDDPSVSAPLREEYGALLSPVQVDLSKAMKLLGIEKEERPCST